MKTNFPKYYFIADLYKEKRKAVYIRRMILCDFVARSVLAKGYKWWATYNFEKSLEFQKEMKDLWVYNIIPPTGYELHKIKIKDVKWYIKKYITVQGSIWNGSFMRGLTVSGRIIKDKQSFPSLLTHVRKKFLFILKYCPFTGSLNDGGWKDGLKWNHVPALSLPYDEESLSFMAGVFSMGSEHRMDDGLVYARYSLKCKKYFEAWGIPIEGYTKTRMNCLISPFWPALLHKYMPPILRTWERIPDAAHAHKYAAMLWKIYHNRDFERNAIPYLASGEYYKKRFMSEDKTLTQNLKRMWVQHGLTELDDRLKNLIRGRDFV